MKNWESSIISPQTSIMEAIRVVDDSGCQIALVVDGKRHLLGTVTDGDIRRAILRQMSLDAPVAEIMFTSVTVAGVHDDHEKILATMRKRKLRHIPIVDETGKIVALRALINILERPTVDYPVVIMAGGMGTRLSPLTSDCPKPLLKVGGKPILETIIESFVEQGFKNIFITVHYKAEKIENYFGDGSALGIDINYIHEKKRYSSSHASKNKKIRLNSIWRRIMFK